MSSITRLPNQRLNWVLLAAKLVIVSLWLNGCVIRLTTLSTEGGSINGKIYAGGGTAVRTRIQLPNFPLYLREMRTNRAVGYTVTDPMGNYTFSALSPGKYQICWQQAGWVTGCSPEEISVGRDPTTYAADLFIAPAISMDQAGNIKAGVVWGNVRLRNGTLPVFRSRLFAINVKTKVELLDQHDDVIQGPIEPTLNGDFVFTDVPISADRVRARFGNDVVEGTLSDKTRILTGVMPIRLIFTNHIPVIAEIKADLAQQTRENGRPVVTVHARVNDEDGDPLTYRWIVVESAAAVTGQEDSATWRFPAPPGLYTLYLFVQDSKGGYASSDLTLSNTEDQVVDPNVVLEASLVHKGSAFATKICQKPSVAHGPPHSNPFLTLDYRVGDATETDAQNYYKAVDPLNQRKNLIGWWQTNGFDQAGQPVAGTGVITAHLDYLNTSLLGVGRDMHCLRQISGRVACYVTNYGLANQDPKNTDLAAAHNLNVAAATVAMEYAPIEGSSDPTPVVKFFAFDKLKIDRGIRITGLKLGGNDFAYLPTLCLYCHGGQYVASQGTNQANLGANFREFDSKTFCFPQSRLQPTAPEAQTIHRLNQMILATNPAQSIQTLIQNWYPSSGSSDTPVDYVASDWQVSGQSGQQVQPEQLYRKVVNRTCRPCHIAYVGANRFDWSTYAQFNAKKSVICPIVFEAPQMPHAKIPYDNFWRVHQDQPEFLAKYLGYDWSGGAHGCPVP
jgi:hypothetical protein